MAACLILGAFGISSAEPLMDGSAPSDGTAATQESTGADSVDEAESGTTTAPAETGAAGVAPQIDVEAPPEPQPEAGAAPTEQTAQQTNAPQLRAAASEDYENPDTEDSTAVIIVSDGQENHFDTFDQAYAAAKDGDTIKLIKDNSFAGGYISKKLTVTSEGGPFTLTLGGKTNITANITISNLNVTGNNSAGILVDDATLTLGIGTEISALKYSYGVSVFGMIIGLSQPGRLEVQEGASITEFQNVGVWVKSGSTVNMSGGTISGNKGTGVWINGGAMVMSGGTISGNTYARYDGGVRVNGTGSVFTMQGGTISDNTGCGVAVGDGGRFEMIGGTIRGNAGGVYSGGSNGEMVMSGGSIINNASNETIGGGIYFSNGKLTLSGNVNITGNTAKWQGVARADNLFVYTDRIVDMTNIGKDAAVGVRTMTDPSKETPAMIGSGASVPADVCADGAGLKVKADGKGNILLCASVPEIATIVGEDGIATSYETIKEAIDASANGDIITIAPGTHDEAVTLTKAITLEGQGDGSAVLTGGVTLAGPFGDNTKTVIKGLKFEKSGIYASAWGNEPNLNNLTIENNIFENITEWSAAINLNLDVKSAPKNLTIANNTITNVAMANGSGIWISATAGTTQIMGNKISNTTLNSLQITGAAGGDVTISGNILENWDSDVASGGRAMRLTAKDNTNMTITRNSMSRTLAAGEDGAEIVKITDLDGTLNAEKNYWNAAKPDFSAVLKAYKTGGAAADNAQLIVMPYYADAALTQLVEYNVKNERSGKTYATLQEAIAELVAGDTIVLEEGTFAATNNDQFRIEQPNVTIKGQGDKSVIDCGSYTTGAGQAAFFVLADNVTIDNVKIVSSAGTNALKFTGGIGAAADTTTLLNGGSVKNVTLSTATGNALNIHGVRDMKIDGLKVENAAKCSISISRSDNVTVENTTTASGGWGDIGMMYSASGAGYEAPSALILGAGNDFKNGTIYSERPSAAPGGTDIVSGYEQLGLAKQVAEDGTWKLVPYTVKNARSGETYDTLQQAINKAQAGDTILLGADCTFGTTTQTDYDEDGVGYGMYGAIWKPLTIRSEGAPRTITLTDVISVKPYVDSKAPQFLYDVDVTFENVIIDGENKIGTSGIEIAGGATLRLGGGTTIRHCAFTSGGAAISVGGIGGSGGDGKLIMNDGALITQNVNSGVYVQPTGVFEMNGGKIADNTCQPTALTQQAYGIINKSGAVLMTGGEISSNGGKTAGGGISVIGTGATISVDGGVISNNTKNGGIYVTSADCTISLHDAMITGNSTGNYGSIGGSSSAANLKVFLSGNTQITDNKYAGTACNLKTAPNMTVDITDLGTGAKIGITPYSKSAGYEVAGADDAHSIRPECFTPDTALNANISLVRIGNKLMTGYTTTLRAAGLAQNRFECTGTAPALQMQGVSVVASNNATLEDPAIGFLYYTDNNAQIGTLLDDAPVAAGTYWARPVYDGSTTGYYGASEGADAYQYQIAVPVSSVSLNQSAISLDMGTKGKLCATVLPADAADKTLAWASSNQAVLAVDNGVLTPIAPGTATITATSANGKEASCVVTVAEPPKTNPVLPGTEDKIPVVVEPEVSGNTLDSNALKDTIANAKPDEAVVVKVNVQNSADAKVESSVIEAAAQAAQNGGAQTVAFSMTDANGNVSSSVTLDLSQGVDPEKLKDINLGYTNTVSAATEQKAKEGIPEDAEVMFINLTHDGVFPCPITRVDKVGGNFRAGDTVYLYYVSASGLSEEQVLTVDANGFITYTITHASPYVLSTQRSIAVTTPENPPTDGGGTILPNPGDGGTALTNDPGTDNNEGVLPISDTDLSEKTTTKAAPKTDDAQDMTVYLLLLVLSGTVVSVPLFKRKYVKK